jgi:hypothetical protein
VDERWEFEEVNPGHFPYSRREERVDSVAGASGEAEDAGVGTEEAEAAERGQEGFGKGHSAAPPALGGSELSETAVRGQHAAGGGVAGGAWKGS